MKEVRCVPKFQRHKESIDNIVFYLNVFIVLQAKCGCIGGIIASAPELATALLLLAKTTQDPCINNKALEHF